MWLIPGDTKVKIEIFKGIGLRDLLVGIVGGGTAALLFLSNLPFKLIASVVMLVVTVFLVLSIDDQPNYIFLLNIIKFLTYTHKYDIRLAPVGEDAEARKKKRKKKKAEEEEFDLSAEAVVHEPAPFTKEELKARKKAQKAEHKADDKLLRSKKLSKEEEDAIWLKRAKQEAENKKIRQKTRAANAKVDSMVNLRPYTDIKDNLISYGGRYYGAVVEVPPVEFRFFSKMRRNNTIVNGIGKALRQLNQNYAFNLVKVERKVDYSKYRDNEMKRLDALKQAFELGVIEEEELQRRIDVINGRVSEIDKMMTGEPIIVPYFYLVIFDADRTLLENQVRAFMETLETGEMFPKRLDDKELAVFLKYTNTLDFDEKEIDSLEREDYVRWASPDKLDIRTNTVAVNGLLTQNMRVVRYPSTVNSAWLASVMSLPSTKVVVKCTPMDREKSIRAIDRSLLELRASLTDSMADSRRLEISTHIQSLESLLRTLQGETESLLSTNIYVTSYDVVGSENDLLLSEHVNSERRRNNNMRKYVKHIYRERGMRLSSMTFEQMETYIGSQVSGYDPYMKDGRGMPTNTLGAAYPWVFPSIADEGGIRLGSSEGVPVFLNMFKRDSVRVNSNMVIVGKSGSGKSYATKTLLSNLATEDARIFILDPENEYAELASNLDGKFINVGNASNGRLNPFQIMTTLEDEGETEGPSDSFSTHLQFLEEFFQQIMPDCDKDALEYLNTIMERMYAEKGITQDSDISKLKPEDYPIFDDLYDNVLREFQSTENEFLRSMLRTLMNYVSKFAADGRNANIWNGPSSITTDENFCVFNFQSLLSNRNGSIANAQMLLVLKYIDNEIIKNRDYNLKYHTNRKIVVVIDEAHVFIDTKFPIALDFMFQLAKRIRKYNGMQIVITQNIKDFVGSEDIARKSTAIINACQYSFIFSLAPNDMADLCKLYEKSGGINEVEQEQIVNAKRGETFMILGPSSRTSFTIDARPEVKSLFEDMNYVSPFYGDEAGKESWDQFIEESRENRNVNLLERFMEQEEAMERESADEQDGFSAGGFRFNEIGESEWNEMEKAREEEEQKKAEEEKQKEEERKQAELSERLRAEEEKQKLLAAELETRKAKEELQAPQSPVQQAVQPVVQTIAAPAASSRVEEMLTELLGQFSHATMQSEINRRVEEEVNKRMDSVMESFAQKGGIPAKAAAVAAEQPSYTEKTVPVKAEEPEETEDLFTDLFGLMDEEPAESAESSEAPEEESEDLFGFGDDTEEEESEDLFGFGNDTEEEESGDLFGFGDDTEEEESEDLFGFGDDTEEEESEDLFGFGDDTEEEESGDLFGFGDDTEEEESGDLFGFGDDTEEESGSAPGEDFLDEEEDEETDDFLSGLFGEMNEDEEEEASEDEEASEEEEVEDTDFLKSLFGFDEEKPEEEEASGNEEEETEEADDSDFDLGSLLGDMFDEMDEISSIEQMSLYGDTVIDITIDDLNKYVRNLRNSQQSANG